MIEDNRLSLFSQRLLRSSYHVCLKAPVPSILRDLESPLSTINSEITGLIEDLENSLNVRVGKLNQVGAEIYEPQKLNRPEITFPAISYVPGKHHALIVQRCKTI